MNTMNRMSKRKFIAVTTAVLLAVAMLLWQRNSPMVYAAETDALDSAAAVHVLCLESDGEAIYAGTLDGGIYKSTDRGESWTAANNGINSDSIRGIYYDAGALYAYSWKGIYKSTDGAQSWKSINTGLLSNTVSAMISDGAALYAATTQGIYKSTDGETWSFSNSGLEGTITTAFAFDGTTIFAGTEYNGIYKSVNGGTNWHNINNDIGQELSLLSMEYFDGALYAGTHLGIYKTDNGGISWDILNSDWANPKASALYFDGSALCAGTLDGEIYKSADGGKTWDMTGNISGGIRALLSDGLVFYAGTNDGAYKSDDGGLNWNISDIGIVKTYDGNEETYNAANLAPYRPGRAGKIMGSVLLALIILGLGAAALYLLLKMYQQSEHEETDPIQYIKQEAKPILAKIKELAQKRNTDKPEEINAKSAKPADVKDDPQAEKNSKTDQKTKAMPKTPAKSKDSKTSKEEKPKK